MNVADVLSGSAGLAGVRWLLLATTPRQLLRRELEALLASPGQVARCRIRRATFKPGRRLAACYDVDLRMNGRVGPRRPIAVTWTADTERSGADGSADVAAEEDQDAGLVGLEGEEAGEQE